MSYLETIRDPRERSKYILDLIYNTFSVWEHDHSSLTPFFNPLKLLIQKQIIISVVAHNGKEKIGNFRWSQHGRIIIRSAGISDAPASAPDAGTDTIKERVGKK